MQVYDLILYFFTYGLLGWCTEVAFAAVKQGRFVNRGFLNGPICPIYGVGVCVVVSFLEPLAGNMVLLYLVSTVLVTVLEGLTGYFMDRIFHHKWWDYSEQPLNIGGYVCLLFSLVWGVACVFIVRVFHPAVHKLLVLIPPVTGMVLVCVLSVVLFADLYVTASGILKFNRQLESMQKIADELREISDRLGESIYENVMETMEATQEQRRKIEETAAEQRRKIEETATEQRRKIEEITSEQRQKSRARMEELRARYEALSGQRPKVASRLLKAFPRMESRRHKAVLEELKMKMRDRF